jgi:general L-amino acid transport system permease protein
VNVEEGVNQASGATERIPFWRNVKTLGLLAQVIFAVVVLAAILVLWNNVTSALARSSLPADFSWLTSRAGLPIGERPIPYTPDDPYWRALLIGFLNTLKIAVVGVVLASILGVLVGLARLSNNWLLRQIGTWYVEILRNTPLSVQIIFWFTAAIATLPPTISAPVRLPGGVLFSNRGLAFPAIYPGFGFSAWLPWLVAATVIFVVVLLVRRRQIRASERPGLAWPSALAGWVLVAGVGFAVASQQAQIPTTLAVDFVTERGRGVTFLDANGNGARDRGEAAYGHVPVTVRVPEAAIEARSSNLVEQRRVKPSVIRFPVIEQSEIETFDVSILGEADAERFNIHWFDAPVSGLIYEDRNQDGVWQEGEELGVDGEGFQGVRTVLTVTGFERRLVSDRDGAVRIPNFDPVGTHAEEVEEIEDAGRSGAGGFGPSNLFGTGASTSTESDNGPTLETMVEIRESGALLWSPPSVPVSNYTGGFRFTASYLALLLALVIYTATFIAEITRAGIMAVPKGQTEAAKALGLSGSQTFSLVVFPQAVRIILPPMISQYLNLTKNSSLAPLAAYAEIFAISAVVANQTGASVPVTILIIVSYLIISWFFSIVLNIVNARMAIVER